MLTAKKLGFRFSSELFWRWPRFNHRRTIAIAQAALFRLHRLQFHKSEKFDIPELPKNNSLAYFCLQESGVRRSFKLILLSLVCLTCGCAGFSEYRKGRIAERQAEEASSINFDSLWKQGYGYNNPNTGRREQGLESQNFDGSLNSDKKKGYFSTLVDDAITHSFNKAVNSMIAGTSRLFNR